MESFRNFITVDRVSILISTRKQSQAQPKNIWWWTRADRCGVWDSPVVGGEVPVALLSLCSCGSSSEGSEVVGGMSPAGALRDQIRIEPKLQVTARTCRRSGALLHQTGSVGSILILAVVWSPLLHRAGSVRQRGAHFNAQTALLHRAGSVLASVDAAEEDAQPWGAAAVGRIAWEFRSAAASRGRRLCSESGTRRPNLSQRHRGGGDYEVTGISSWCWTDLSL